MSTTHRLLPDAFRFLIFFVLLAGLSSCSPPRDVAHRVQLILNSDGIEPTTTFELRFEQLAVRPEEVGQRAERSPLSISPSLAGDFTWMSQRSGLFTPTQPPALGQTYRFTLAPGLHGPDGQTLRARLDRTLKAPSLSFSHGTAEYFQRTNAPALPQFFLQFNADIALHVVSNYVVFQAANGQRAPATVEPRLVSHGYGIGAPTRRQRFETARSSATNGPSGIDAERNGGQLTISNQLVIKPSQPLPVARGWKLVLARGLPASEFNARLPETQEIVLGDVTPFRLADLSIGNELNRGKSVQLSFSKPISSTVTPDNITNWVQITPAAERDFVVGPDTITVTGVFEDQSKVALKKGLPSADGLVLNDDWSRALAFEPVPPRLYFPAFETAQLSEGSRRFGLMSVNVPRVRLRAKLLDRQNLIHALRGYQSYFATFEDFLLHRRRQGFSHFRSDLEPYRKIDFNVVPGRTIFQTNVTLPSVLDRADQLDLAWDEILGGRRHAAVFLVAERDPGSDQETATLGAQSLVQLTDLGVVWKRWGTNALVYLFSHATAEPVGGASIQLVSDENEPLADVVTDTNGIATFPMQEKSQWLLAENEDDLHAVAFGAKARSLYLYSYNLPLAWNQEGDARRKVMLFTDRTTYRPGEFLYLKGIVRELSADGLKFVSRRADLRWFDARGNRWWQTNLTLSANGSLDAVVTLPDNGGLGGYRVEVEIEKVAYLHYFQVQEFRPSAFQVSFKAQESYRADEPLNLRIGAQYYMGKSLSQATVRWSMEVADTMFQPAGFADYVFGPQENSFASEFGRTRSSFTLQGEGRLSREGLFELHPDIKLNSQAPQPQKISLFAEITDAGQQTVSGSGETVRHSSDFYLGLKRQMEVLGAGAMLPVELIAVSATNGSWNQPVTAQLTLTRLEWINNLIQSAGGRISYRHELQKTQLARQQVEIPARTGVSGSPVANASFELTEPGEYLLDAEATDTGGRPILTSMMFHVFGSDRAAWHYRNNRQIDLKPDQLEYDYGDVATILVKTPISGRALVTVERDGVLRSFVTTLDGNAPSINVPLIKSDAPNVFVSVLLLRGAEASPHQFKEPEYRLGYCQINVAQPETELDISIHTSQPTYRPGEYIDVVAAVTNAAGQPEADAEVTLYAVDEGILSLAAETVPNPHAYFHAAQPLSVATGISLPDLLDEDPEQRTYSNKGYLIGGGGNSAGRVRKNFIPCPLWQAQLHSDADGRVAARFRAPDSLTRYRIVAVAHSGSDRFGSAAAKVEVNKPLMIEPALPHFANVSDRILARAVVHNLTDRSGTVEVRVQLDETATTTAAARLVEVKARGTAQTEFPLVFHKAGVAKWTWKAQFIDRFTQDSPEVRPISTRGEEKEVTKFTDAVETTLAVGHVAPLLREVLSGRIVHRETNLLAAANPQLLEGDGTVTVRISNTRLSELNEPVEHLLRYPYGCVEQTSSSLLPWLVLRDFQQLIPLGKTSAEIDSAIHAGIKRLLSMQTTSGGLAYWPGGTSAMFWGAAYANLPLTLAERAGIPLPTGDLERLRAYLRDQLRISTTDQGPYQLSAHCLAVYGLALSRKPEPSYHEVLFQKRTLLSQEERALLALAIAESGGDNKMIRELLTLPPPASEETNEHWFGCPARDAALQLLAWCRFHPSAPETERAIERLMRERQNGHWTTTQGNAWSLLALTEYARRVEGRTQGGTGSLAWGGENRAFQLRAQPDVTVQTFDLSAFQPHQELRLLNAGGTTLYVQTQLSARSRVSRQPRQDHGYALHRTYSRLDHQGDLHPAVDLRVGETILVTLQLDVRRPARYLAIDDALPSIFEAVNPEFKDQGNRAAGKLSGNWFTSYRELRKDRTLFFADYISPGQYTIRYVARVRAAGQVTAPAAKVEEMYHPERFGLTETADITGIAGE